MMKTNGFFHVILITVCVEPVMEKQLTQAVSRMPWRTTSSHLNSYISRSRRPAFGPQVKEASAGIVFVDFDKDPEEAVETAEYLSQTFGSKIAIIAIAANRDPDLILRAVRAGCNEFLQSPVRDLVLSETLNRLDRQWSTDKDHSEKTGSILAFFGAKGGVGTTTLAVHLAVYLVSRHRKRVLLIDNHPELGHACVYLGLDGGHFLFNEVVRNVSRLDSELLHGFAAVHSSGLDVLSSPDVSGGGVRLDSDAMVRTLDFLRSEYDYVVVDCDRTFSDANMTVFASAAQMYLVSTPEVGAIRDLSRHVDRLTHIDDSADKLQIILNRFASPFAINAEQIEKALKMPISIRIPNNYPEMVRSENLGEPISPDSKSEIALEFMRWADSLVGVPPPATAMKKAKGLRGFWPAKNLVTQG